jgi:hypothetical protein
MKVYAVDLFFYKDSTIRACMCETDKMDVDQMVEKTDTYERYRLFYSNFKEANDHVQRICIINILQNKMLETRQATINAN